MSTLDLVMDPVYMRPQLSYRSGEHSSSFVSSEFQVPIKSDIQTQWGTQFQLENTFAGKLAAIELLFFLERICNFRMLMLVIFFC